MDGANPISPQDLFEWLDTTARPLVFDVRRAAVFAADSQMLASAQRGAPGSVVQWAEQIPAGRPVVVYCVYGHEVSQGVAAALRESGIDARYLAGGINGWIELGLPVQNKAEAEPPRAPGGQA